MTEQWMQKSIRCFFVMAMSQADRVFLIEIIKNMAFSDKYM